DPGRPPGVRPRPGRSAGAPDEVPPPCHGSLCDEKALEVHLVPRRLHSPGRLKSTLNSRFVHFSQSQRFAKKCRRRRLTPGSAGSTLSAIPLPDKRTTIMAHSQRRQFLKDLLGTMVQGAGTVVLASVATTHALANVTGGPNTDIQKRAHELAEAAGA